MVAPPARKTVSPRSAERRTGVSLVLTLVVATLVVSVAGAGTAAANAPVDAPGDASPVADAGSANGLTNATLAARTAGDARFSPSVVREDRGDVMTIPVHTSKAATVNLGSPEVGFCLAVGVGKGTTKLAVNTYETGDPTTMVTATKGTIKSRTRCGPMPRAPLDVATYPMNVTIGGEEEALGTFIVTERRTEGATGLVAPRETDLSEVESVGDVESVATPLGNATVASGDWFVYRIDASGLGGFLEKGILDGDGEDVTVRFEQVDGRMNADPKEFTGDTAAKLLAVPDSETYFLFVDTAEHDIEPGERYDARFTVGKSNPLVDEAESVNTTFEVVERRTTVDYDVLPYAVENETTITGNTTLAPGSKVTITARHQGVPPFLRERTATVTANRTFAATFDFKHVPEGLDFDLLFDDPELDIPAVKPDEPVATETATETPANDTTPNGTATANATTPTPTPTSTPTATPTPTPTPYPTERPLTPQPVESSGMPGFGADVALVALALCVLALARRRGGRGD